MKIQGLSEYDDALTISDVKRDPHFQESYENLDYFFYADDDDDYFFECELATILDDFLDNYQSNPKKRKKSDGGDNEIACQAKKKKITEEGSDLIESEMLSSGIRWFFGQIKTF